MRVLVRAEHGKAAADRGRHQLRNQDRVLGTDAVLETVPQIEERLHPRARGRARPEPLADEGATGNDLLEVAPQNLGVLDPARKDRHDLAGSPHEPVGPLADGLDLTALDLREGGMMDLLDLPPPPRLKHDTLARVESDADFLAAEHTRFSGGKEYIRIEGGRNEPPSS